MATARLGIAAICSVLMTAGNWAVQDSTAPALSIRDITAEIGSDVDAHNVLGIVLTHAMATGPRREFFLTSQMRNEWLPAIPGVEFVRLADSEVGAHLAGCGRYWIIGHLQRVDNVVTMWLNQVCGGSTLQYIVSFDGSEWRLGPPGAGKNGGGWVPGRASGFVRRPPGCPCS
jgi:hypothetical protein